MTHHWKWGKNPLNFVVSPENQLVHSSECQWWFFEHFIQPHIVSSHTVSHSLGVQSVVVDLVVGQIGRSVGRGNSWDEPKVKKIKRYILLFFIITEGGKIWPSQSWIVRSDFYLNLWIVNGLQIARNNKQKRSDRAMNGPDNQREGKVLQIQSNTCIR